MCMGVFFLRWVKLLVESLRQKGKEEEKEESTPYDAH